MKNYKISEIAKISGVSVKALRGYEDKGLISPSRGIESNYRLYSETSIATIQNIKLLQNLGFSLKEISLIHNGNNIDKLELKSVFKKHLEKTKEDIRNLAERKSILNNIIQKFDEDLEASILTAREKDIFMGITTGFTKLDKILEGEKKGQLIFIAARPGMGKTALTVHIAYNLIEQTGLPISFFSTEFDHDEWVDRLAIQKTRIDRYKQVLSKEEEDDLQAAKSLVKKKSIYYRHNKSIPIDEITKNTLEIEGPLGAVVIDYFQDIKGDTEYKCLKLKELSTLLNCPVLVINTVSDKVEARSDKRPNPNDLNDFESISSVYDKLLIVSQDPSMALSDSKKIAHIDVYSQSREQFSHLNLVWDGTYCGYSESL